MSESPEYITASEAATRIKMSKRFIDNLIASGELPVHRFGRSVRIKVSTLDALAESASQSPIKGRTGRG